MNYWASIGPHPLGWCGAQVVDNRQIATQVNGEASWALPAAGSPLWTSIAADPNGSLTVGFQMEVGSRDMAFIATKYGGVMPLLDAFGNQLSVGTYRGVVVRWVSGALRTYVCIDSRHYVIDGGPPIENPYPDGSVLGIMDVDETGHILWAQQALDTSYGYPLAYRWPLGNYIFGQDTRSDSIVVVDKGSTTTVFPGPCKEYQVAMQPNGQIAACVHGAFGVKYAVVQPVSSTPAPKPCYQRKMIWAPFHSHNSNGWGVTDDFVGNIGIPDRSLYGAFPGPIIQFLNNANNPGSGYDSAWLNKTLYYLLHAPSLAEIRSAYEAAVLLPEKPIIIVNDGQWGALPPWVNKRRTFLGVKAYRESSESIPQFTDRILNEVGQVTKLGCPTLIVPAMYDRNGTQSAGFVLESESVYDMLLRSDEFKLIGALPFSDMRPGGMNSHPELKDMSRRLFNLIPARPNRLDGWMSTNWRENLLIKVNYDWPVLVTTEQQYLIALIQRDLAAKP